MLNGVLGAEVGHSCHEGLVEGDLEGLHQIQQAWLSRMFLVANRTRIFQMGASVYLPSSDKSRELSEDKQVSEWSWSPGWRGWDRRDSPSACMSLHSA